MGEVYHRLLISGDGVQGKGNLFGTLGWGLLGSKILVQSSTHWAE